MPRQEYKFLIPAAKLPALRSMILPHVEMDPYAADRPGHEYTVQSLYLDTDRLDFYHEKLAGVKDRMKIRIRGYNAILPATPVYLEIKRKSGIAVLKRRSSLACRDLAAILETCDPERYISRNSRREDALTNAREFLYHLRRRCLGPVITIVYEREPFFSRHDSTLRITVDKNLRSVTEPLFSLDTSRAIRVRALRDHVILEVKSDYGFPLWLRLILSRLDLTHEAISKYTTCIDSLTEVRYRCEPTRSWTIRDRCLSFPSPTA